jgi:hypothetical protein
LVWQTNTRAVILMGYDMNFREIIKSINEILSMCFMLLFCSLIVIMIVYFSKLNNQINTENEILLHEGKTK